MKIKSQKILTIYLMTLFLMMIIPLGGVSAGLNNFSVLQLRLDYLVHGLVFVPLVILWRMRFPGHPVWLILAGGIAIASGLEVIQYLLPYRAWNINDLVGNGAGVLLGGGLFRAFGLVLKKC
ncbi:VanZ family protein [Desulfobacula sp.]|uniref:VanZ family protein n=1 Tax=Desulfobacula sp. TaxID=2593537 RepID=UPI0025B92EDB|nr:VanZ family protein [Desulfobacula sp.]MBC2704220.1 VanZ family protein [Desulfobacula sp.]